MTLGVCQGHSSIASFSILTSASRSPSAIAELLVKTLPLLNVTACDLEIPSNLLKVIGNNAIW